MAEMYTQAFVQQLQRGAQSLAGRWGLSARTKVTLLNLSENATFRADDPDRAAPLILRVHRPGYHTRLEIESELAWIDAIAAENVASIARPVPTRSGEKIAEFALGADRRQVVAFEFVAGREPSPNEDLAEGFHSLGAITARLHRHARGWARPAWFVRKVWDFDATVGAGAHWGDWRAALGLTADGAALLEQVAAALQAALARYGRGDDRFGLIHADLRLANLLVSDQRIAVIDFDDCGVGWFGFDFAAAVSFFETDPQVPALQAAWVDGYRSEQPFAVEDEAMLGTFVMLRRLQLTAWVASHAETPTAQEMGAPFTDGTLAIGERYLASVG